MNVLQNKKKVMELDHIIEVHDFVKQYGKFTAVNEISFTVESGSIFAFLGPNGAGKSTTINILCTILEQTSGTATIDGKSVCHDKDAVRNIIGVVFQEATLDINMTVEENLVMHCYFYGLPKSVFKERIDFVLSLVDLLDWKKAPASSLSGGMRRRVELARSLLHFPKVLFLDEPTTGLDPQTRARIWEYLTKLQREKGITIFLTTHYMDEAEICDKVAVMDHGRIIAFDTPASLKQQYTMDKAYITSVDPEDLGDLLARYELNSRQEGNGYVAELDDLAAFMQLISEHRTSIIDLEIRKGTLNDVFLVITGKDIRG